MRTCLLKITVIVLIAMMPSGCSIQTVNRLAGDGTDALNSQACDLISNGKYDEAIEILDGVIKIDDRDDAAYDNMARALYLKGDYGKAFEYSEKALGISPNTETEYINHGNITLQISDDYEKALNDYNMALSANAESPNATYGKGLSLSLLNRYGEAYDAYNEYLKLAPDDPDGHENLGYVCLNLEKADEAETQAMWLQNNEKGLPDGLLLQTACQYMKGSPGQSLVTFEKALASDDFSYDRMDGLYGYMTKIGDYAFAKDLLELYIKNEKPDSQAYLDLVSCEKNLQDYTDAKSTCNEAIETFPDNAELHNVLGDLYSQETAYRDAVSEYALASERDPGYWQAESNLIWGMYQAGDYQACIDYCSKLENAGKKEYEVFWYQAACFEAIFDNKKAIEYYEKSLPFDAGDDSDTYYRIAMLYYGDGDVKSADENNRLSLESNPDNQDAVWLSNQIRMKSKPITEQLIDFIGNNYLYRGYIPDFKTKLDEFNRITEPTAENIGKVIKGLTPDYDYFTFFLTGEDYKAYREELDVDTVHHSIMDNKGGSRDIHLFKIDFFASRTGLEFIDLARKIKDPGNSVLVIDLRGNTGGDMDASCQILDYLLGQCVTCSLYDKDGYSDSYYSNADKTDFYKICILTDGNTASASELLTLGLLTYDDNAVAIGEKTYGKGVCQVVFDSPEYGFALFLVDTYWNVRQNNIDYYGITPDVNAKSESEYETAILDSIK